jgi:alginate O-acetyltransferase complex protein AlgI
MVFTSFNFLVFFPLILILYFFTPARYRWITLLVSSYFFYINVKPVFAIITVIVTLVTYLFTSLMDKTINESRRKVFLVFNIVLILLPLFFFKYFVDINRGIFNMLDSFHVRWVLPDMKLFLPIGISFYTFMAIGYTVDVYNEEIEAEKNIGILALFISFFPLILSGPIERAKNMLPQFKEHKNPDYLLVEQGIKLMLWGYFMKLVVADRVGIYVDAVYNNIGQHNGTTLFFASVLYPFQVYSDLGGYSLIAIGVSKALGISVMQNFNRPFFSTSMSEFWRRWHISLISWLTDYVFTPLSFTFRKYKIWGVVIALMITFLISGIWHGAKLTFIVWGLLQGTFLSIEALTNRRRQVFEKNHNLGKKWWYIFIGIFLTFSLFAASQIFARAENLDDSISVYRKILTDPGPLFIGGLQQFIYCISATGLLFIIEFGQEFIMKNKQSLLSKYWFVDHLAYAFLIIIILLVGVFDGGQFIYFQF